MSRIAKLPIIIPDDLEVNLINQFLILKNKKEEIKIMINKKVTIEIDNKVIKVSCNKDISLAGTYRTIVNNAVSGLIKKFEKKLVLVGVGYKAQIKDKVLNLTLGYSHLINFQIPTGIDIQTPNQTEILISGSNKQQVGQIAAKLRSFRPPEPYKGKGVKYDVEEIIRKEAKKK